MTTDTRPDRRWIALLLLCAAQFMVVLDASIVNVALPSVQRELGVDEQDLQWVVNAYVLLFGGFLLLGGRAADLLGRRRVFITGLLVFSIASLLGGLATSPGQLIGARALQGLGAAIVSPAALSIVTTTFAEGAERNRALGIWGAVAGSGGAVGVLLGGILTDSLGWEWVLFVNVPIGLAAAALSPVLLRESRADVARRRFDALGAITVTTGLVLLTYTIVEAASVGWGSAQTLGLGALAIALLAAFVVIETRASAPLVPFGLFRSRTLTGANVVGLLVGASLFSMFFFISLYMQNVLGFTPLEAGLAYLPLSLAIIVSAGAASQLVTRFGVRPVLVGGMLLVTAGLLWFSQVSAGGSYVSDVLGPSILAGAGLGFAFVPVTVAAVGGVRAEESGLASGLINTAQQVGGALGLAVLVTISTSRTEDVIAGADDARAALPGALTEGFQIAFAIGAGIALVGALIAFVLMRGAEVSREGEGEEALAPVSA